MFNRRMTLAAAGLGLVAMLAGCGGGSAVPAGSDFVGTWVNVKTAANTLQIERQDAGFVVRETASNWITGRPQTKAIPAVLLDGRLEVRAGGAATKLMVDKATGRLTNGRAEYQRAAG